MQNGGLVPSLMTRDLKIDTLIDYYLENAKILEECFLDLGFKVHGGTDAPYIL